MSNTVATAYVQLVASASGLKSQIESEMGVAGTSSGSSFASSFKAAGTTALKAVGGAVAATSAAAVTGIAAMTKSSLDSYADYEQLVGGVETLFGDSASVVEGYASEAYKTAGMSANDYMETVTSFSASLLQSLDGDTAAAAEKANLALTDMSDNANKMGTDMDSIENAYQGFAKQNYTMLDNLKLGYGGTASEMQRLIEDAEDLDSSFQAARDENGDLAMSYSDIVDAIHIVQTNMGITGTTATEASTTISGSISTMSAAWTDLLTGIASGDADLGVLVDNFASSIITVKDNVVPRIQEILPNIVDAITQLASSLLPEISSTAITLIQSFCDFVISDLPMLIDTALTFVMQLCQYLLDELPLIADSAVQIVLTLIQGLSDTLPELIPAAVDAVITIVEGLTAPDTLGMLLSAAFELIEGLAVGIINAIPELLESVPVVISNIIASLISALPQFVQCGVALFLAIIENLPSIILELVSASGMIVDELIATFNDPKFQQQMAAAGVQLLKGLMSGITSFLPNLIQNCSSAMNNVIATVKKTFGIHSPSKVFAGIGQNLDQGLANGISDNLGVVDSATEDLINAASFETGAINSNVSLASGANNGSVFGGVQIVVNAAAGQSEETIAELVSQKLANQYSRQKAAFA